jgi:dTDP-4-amino-4,6-dideoxygalactose transaminase
LAVNGLVIVRHPGRRRVFADVRPDSRSIDDRHVERLISSRTRAIAALQHAGVGCDMDALAALREKRGGDCRRQCARPVRPLQGSIVGN